MSVEIETDRLPGRLFRDWEQTARPTASGGPGRSAGRDGFAEQADRPLRRGWAAWPGQGKINREGVARTTFRKLFAPGKEGKVSVSSDHVQGGTTMSKSKKVVLSTVLLALSVGVGVAVSADPPLTDKERLGKFIFEDS